ncbi:lytic polysaccharide monooxygenase, partial [Aulographum hederae CBS 113979]
MTLIKRTSALLCTICLIPLAAAHFQMVDPLPFRSPKDTELTSSQVDYDITSPLAADGSNYPCKGYQNDENKRTTRTYTVGQSYTMQLSGGASHSGGSCQISLSYDNGATFKVIKSIIGGCPSGEYGYNFTVPTFAPQQTAVFAWTWLNHEGNREFYMDCAQVDIVGDNSGTSSDVKREAASMDDLPNICVANLAEVNGCRTPEGIDPVFPHPGDDVEFGDGMSENS